MSERELDMGHEQTQYSAKEKKERELRRRVYLSLADNYDTYPDNRERVGRIKKDAEHFWGLFNEEAREKFLNELNAIAKMELDKDEYIDRMTACLEPLLQLRFERPEVFEEISRRTFDEKFITINQLLRYGIDESQQMVHIHVAPNETTSMEDKKNMLRDGLRELAKIIQQNPDIAIVTATSWLVAKHPKFITQVLGFTIDGPISEEMRQRYFGTDPRPIDSAHMSREDFLQKYA